MKIKSALMTAGSGSIGGIVASHNRSGMYLRARVIPVNTSTPEQQAVRSAMATLSGRWNSTLTQDQRDAWDIYASLSPVTNAMGDSITLSGLNMFVRSNVPRVQIGIAVLDDAPVTFGVGDAPLITTATATESAQTLHVAGSIGAPADAGDHILIFVSRPQNVGINFFAGPYRFATSVAPTTPPAGTYNEAAVNTPFPFVAGQALFVRCTTSRADGRYSGEGTARLIAGA